MYNSLKINKGEQEIKLVSLFLTQCITTQTCWFFKDYPIAPQEPRSRLR